MVPDYKLISCPKQKRFFYMQDTLSGRSNQARQEYNYANMGGTCISQDCDVKIALFTDSYKPYVSGVVRSIQSFTEELSALGHKVYIFGPAYPQPSRQPTGPESAAGVFRFRSVPVPMYPGFVLPLPVSPGISRRIRSLGVDIIHTHTPFLMGRLALATARRCALPLVFTHHTLYQEYAHYGPMPAGLAQRLLIRVLADYCRQCDLIITPTPSVETLIKKLYHLTTPSVSLPTGIDLKPFEKGDPKWLRAQYDIPSSKRILLYLGRLGQEKNPGFLLDALASVIRQEPNTLLVMAGDGPARAGVEAQAKAAGLHDHVLFVGAVPPDQVAQYYLGADLFVFASTTETQGLVTLEAMVAGLPVVAVDAFGTRDLVADGIHGRLTPQNPEAFALAVVTLLRDESLRRSMGRQAAAKAARFSSRNMALRLVEAYEWAIWRRGGSTRRSGGATPREPRLANGSGTGGRSILSESIWTP